MVEHDGLLYLPETKARRADGEYERLYEKVGSKSMNVNEGCGGRRLCWKFAIVLIDVTIKKPGV